MRRLEKADAVVLRRRRRSRWMHHRRVCRRPCVYCRAGLMRLQASSSWKVLAVRRRSYASRCQRLPTSCVLAAKSWRRSRRCSSPSFTWSSAQTSSGLRQAGLKTASAYHASSFSRRHGTASTISSYTRISATAKVTVRSSTSMAASSRRTGAIPRDARPIHVYFLLKVSVLV